MNTQQPQPNKKRNIREDYIIGAYRDLNRPKPICVSWDPKSNKDYLDFAYDYDLGYEVGIYKQGDYFVAKIMLVGYSEFLACVGNTCPDTGHEALQETRHFASQIIFQLWGDPKKHPFKAIEGEQRKSYLRRKLIASGQFEPELDMDIMKKDAKSPVSDEEAKRIDEKYPNGGHRDYEQYLIKLTNRHKGLEMTEKEKMVNESLDEKKQRESIEEKVKTERMKKEKENEALREALKKSEREIDTLQKIKKTLERFVRISHQKI